MATVVTKKGKDITTARHIGSTPSQAEPKYLGMGLNPNTLTAAINDIAQFQESPESRTTGSLSQITTTYPNDTLQLTGTQTATAARAIQEAGVYDSATQPATNTVAAGGVVGSAGATALNTTTAFSPGNNNYIQIRNEAMQVSAGSGSAALTVVRAQNGTTGITTIAVGDVITPGNIPGVSSIAGGSLFAHADFTVQNLNNGDSITWTWKFQFS